MQRVACFCGRTGSHVGWAVPTGISEQEQGQIAMPPRHFNAVRRKTSAATAPGRKGWMNRWAVPTLRYYDTRMRPRAHSVVTIAKAMIACIAVLGSGTE